jgi:DNA-binding transcriptional ArsR family regulator
MKKNSKSEISSSKNSFPIDGVQIRKASSVVRSINHKLRQQIYNVIAAEKKITVTEIYVKLRIEQSVASQHLAILRKGKVVSTTRDGKFIYYSINETRVKELEKLIAELCK